ENGTTPTAISFDAVVAENYTQIFRTAFGLSGTLQNTRLRTGNKEDEAKTKALKLHMSDIERAFFFGKKHITNSTSATPTRYTGGLITQLSNVIDVSTDTASANTMTEEEFDEKLISDV